MWDWDQIARLPELQEFSDKQRKDIWKTAYRQVSTSSRNENNKGFTSDSLLAVICSVIGGGVPLAISIFVIKRPHPELFSVDFWFILLLGFPITYFAGRYFQYFITKDWIPRLASSIRDRIEMLEYERNLKK